MNPPVYLIDTSYLLELFAVPGCSTEAAVAEVRRRVKDGARNGARLYVTVPCIFELASHISDVADGNLRVFGRNHGRHRSVQSRRRNAMDRLAFSGVSLAQGGCSRLYRHSRPRGIDLTDGTLIDEARRLRQGRYRGPEWRVHIWTKDTKLKAREPDTEPDAFLG